MKPDKTPAHDARIVRLAGALYLVIILCGISGEVVRSQVMSSGTPAAGAIAAHLTSFRLAIVADTLMALADVALAIVLFKLLRPTGHLLASLATAFRLTQATVIGASLILLSGVPGLAQTGDDVMIRILMSMHATGYDIGLIFFGVNALIMSALLLRSGGVPRAIAWGIGGAGLVYLTGSYLRLLAPEMVTAFQPAYLVPLISETALCLWLLIRARI